MIWDIDYCKEEIMRIFNNSSDLVIHQLTTLSGESVMVSYIDNLVDLAALNDFIIKPIIKDLTSVFEIKDTLQVSNIVEASTINEGADLLTFGNVILIHENLEAILVINLSEFQKRNITNSESERVIIGPKEAFIEDIDVKKSLIRRKTRNTNLVFQDYIFGTQTNTKVSIAYIKGIVNPDVLEDLEERLSKIHIDVVLDSHYISSFIEDDNYSILNTVYTTEKPDVVAGKILEGRIAILCDGSPDIITLPMIFIENFMSPEDYYLKYQFASHFRYIRFIAVLVSMLLPAVYTAMTIFHHEMIPTRLLTSIVSQREGVPLSAFLEAPFMIMFFDSMKEAAIRTPSALGSAITLVGGLVIGQAAVDAGVISTLMVIVISISGITEFINNQIRELVTLARLIFLILGRLLGLYGITCGLVVLAVHIIHMKSFGVP